MATYLSTIKANTDQPSLAGATMTDEEPAEYDSLATTVPARITPHFCH